MLNILNNLNGFEIGFVKFIAEIGSGGFIDNLSWLVSWMWFLIALLIIALTIVFLRDRKKFMKIFVVVLIVFLLHFFITDVVIKVALGSIIGIRERPYIAYSELNPIGEKYQDSSFPSGHMASLTGVIFVFIYYFRKNWWIWALGIFAVLLMAFSRMHNAMHYPFDILGGIAFGIAYGMIAVFLYKKEFMVKIRLRKKQK